MKPFFAFLFLVSGLAACASSSDDLPSVKGGLSKCVANQTLVCTCGLLEGHQLCTEDNKLTECDCGQKPDAPVAGSGPDKPGQTGANKCGNGQVDPGEACDDGNQIDGDGCSSDCKPDGSPPSAATCPGQRVLVWQGSPVVLSGTTDGFANNAGASCVPTSTGPDRIYAIQPSADGVLKIDATFSAAFNAVIDLREDACDSAAAFVMCENSHSAPFQRAVPVKKSRLYYLVIDGEGPDTKGVYTIRLELP